MPPKPKRGQAGRFISAAEAAAQAGDSGTEPVPGRGTHEVSARLGDEHTEENTVVAAQTEPPSGIPVTMTEEAQRSSSNDLDSNRAPASTPAQPTMSESPFDGQVPDKGDDKEGGDDVGAVSRAGRVYSSVHNVADLQSTRFENIPSRDRSPDGDESDDSIAHIDPLAQKKNSKDSSAKGKGPDVRNFGNLQFTEDEQDPEIQRQIWESARHQNIHTKPITEATTSRNVRSPSREGSAMRLAALQDEVHRKTMELADYSITSAKLSKQLDDLTRKYDDLLEIMSDRSHTQ
ncbi:hypothetical protein GGF50DRAFT_93308, partial [Schizophyllum commune]